MAVGIERTLERTPFLQDSPRALLREGSRPHNAGRSGRANAFYTHDARRGGMGLDIAGTPWYALLCALRRGDGAPGSPGSTWTT